MMAISLIALFSVVTHARLAHGETEPDVDFNMRGRRVRIFALQHGNASMFLLTSASVSAGNGELQANFFAASLSNVVYPMVSYAYFAKTAAHHKFDNQSFLSFEKSAAGMATVFTRLFQFIDVDKDGEFTNGTDTIVDEYSFREMGPIWTREIDTSVKHAKISTLDGVFSLVYKANEGSGTFLGGQRDPMNTKMNVEINYPTLTEGNLIGLETYIVSTKASASAGISAEKGFYVPQEGDVPSLGFTWESEASLEAGRTSNGVTVSSSAAAKAHLGDLEGEESQILGAIGAKGSLEASLEARRIVHTFNVPPAVKMSWGSTVGVNEIDDDMISGAFSVTCWIMTPGFWLLPLMWVVNFFVALS